MSSLIQSMAISAVLAVISLAAYAAPVDVDGDGMVGPKEVIDLSLNWKGPALPVGIQPWQVDGETIFYTPGIVGIGTNAPNPNARLNVLAYLFGTWAVRGDGPLGGIGVAGVSPGGANARGVYGAVGPGGYCGTSGDHSGSGAYGLLGTANEGVFAFAPNGNGVRGVANGGIGAWGSSDTNVGVYGESSSNNGVSGVSGGANGVYGQSTTGSGVFGFCGPGFGVKGTSTSNSGVFGTSSSSIGVEGRSDSSHGVSGLSSTGTGVYGRSNAIDGEVAGVWGLSPIYGVLGQGEFVGVEAEATDPEGYGLVAHGFPKYGDGTAAYFHGTVAVFGNLEIIGGDLVDSKSLRRIDHPLEPGDKYLTHASVESSEMKNVYDGNIVTDDQGNAEVILPNWFQALNKDFRYQLTVVGQFAQAIVSKEIENNSFEITTDKPNVKVSWQVTGIRQDAYAIAHPLEVESQKPENERGKYLSPELYGQPKEKGIHYRPEMQQVSRSAK